MTDLFANPAIQSGAVPFLIALVTAAVLGFSATISTRFAGLAVLAGFLAANALIFGLPPLPPKSSGQKIAYIALMAGLTGLLLDAVRAHSGRRALVGWIVSTLAIGWLGWRKLMADPSPEHLSMGLLLIGAIIVLAATERRSDDPADKTVPLLIVSIAVAVIAFFGASASIAQNAGALAASLGGVLILNWPKRRFGLDATARLTSLVVLIALVSQMTLFTTSPAWVPILLIPALFADRLAGRFISADSPAAPLFRPVLITFLAAVPAAAAITAAWYAASSSGLSGGY